MKPVPLFPQLLVIDKERRLPHYAPHDDDSILTLLLGRSRDKSTWQQHDISLYAWIVLSILLFCALAAPAADKTQEGIAVALQDKAHPSQILGTVIDVSGALMARVTVQVRTAKGALQSTTQTDRNGTFNVSGLGPGVYRLVVSKPDFEPKELPFTLGGGETQAPLRIALNVSGVNTTVEVQGREDDLTGIADSATQGTVGASEIQDRPILRSGEVLETVPGVIITQHAGGGKSEPILSSRLQSRPWHRFCPLH